MSLHELPTVQVYVLISSNKDTGHIGLAPPIQPLSLSYLLERLYLQESNLFHAEVLGLGCQLMNLEGK